MSDQSEEKLTPEERLLKVIQGKGSSGRSDAEPVSMPTIAQTQSDPQAVRTPPRLRPMPLKPIDAKPAVARSPVAPPVAVVPAGRAVIASAAEPAPVVTEPAPKPAAPVPLVPAPVVPAPPPKPAVTGPVVTAPVPKPAVPAPALRLAVPAPAPSPSTASVFAPLPPVDDAPIMFEDGPDDLHAPSPPAAAAPAKVSESPALASVPIFGIPATSGDAPEVFSDQDVPDEEGDDVTDVVPAKGSRILGISIVNTCVAALLIFTIIVIIAYEVLSAWHETSEISPANTLSSLPPAVSIDRQQELVDLPEMLAAFAARGFLVQPSTPEGEEVAPKPQPSGNSLKQYVKEHIVILGLSWNADRTLQKAILMDRSGPRMHIVQPGDEISVSGGTLRIERIVDDAVVVHDGIEEIVIGKKKA